ncbi:MAG: TonB-dependent receptor plug domain-containing protein [Chitinophagaceae bacterium]
MKKTLSICLLQLLYISCFSQEESTDTSKTLDEVIVRAFEQNRNQRSTTTLVKIIEHNNADRYNKISLVHGLNTVPGVRMEERSPGSYRINIRGSSLRSPFGVRNVKVYWNDIPITDPGGNTYFNQLAYNNFSSIELFKGPAGSMYGAGTGGLILVNNWDRWQPGISIEYITGSYNLHNIFTSVRFGNKENRNQITYAHNQSDGFRVQTKMRRDNFSWQSQLKLSEKQQLTASVLFSDMYYQTPGALTLAEFTANPKSARPAGGGFPSAVNAKAAIYQKNITAGFTNIYNFSSVFKNTTTLYGAFAQIKNPAIRNYERRNEPSFGGRTFFTYTRRSQIEYSGQKENKVQLIGGSEFQQGYFNTQVFKNRNGNPDTLQTNDDINYTTYSLFIQGDINIRESWFINSGISLNKTKVDLTRLSSYPVVKQGRSYKSEIAPRISVKKIITDDLFMKATIARGFSPPTIAELLPSTGVISTSLEAEYGWNYEMTAGYSLFHRKLFIEATGFFFKLTNALVQRRDLSGADFFVNAGNIRQKGIELNADYTTVNHKKGMIDYFSINAGYTYNHFRYGTFIKGADDFSGKKVPSVPANTFSLLADLIFKNGLYANATWYSASKIFLNDANLASAAAYHLLGCRLGWKKTLEKKYKLNFYAGADNLLDESYSLGNDINAAANRFYNAAPRRNYYAGLSLQWIRPPKK